MVSFRVSLALLMAAAGLVSVGNGVLANLVPLRMQMAGFPPLAIGVTATAYTTGFLLGSLLMPRMIRAVGHIRAFAVCAGITLTLTLMFPLAVHWVPWTILRLGNGIFLAGGFLVIESWINDRAPAGSRGRAFSLYIMGNRLSYAIGQLLLSVGDPQGAGLFMLIAALLGMCLVPVSLNRGEAPALPSDRRGMGFFRLFAISPVAAVGAVTSGLVNGAVNNLGPVYSHGIGMTVEQISIFTAAVQVGNVLLQYPVGRWSDTGDRRRVIVLTASVGAVVCFVLALFRDLPFPVMVALATLLGGMTLCLYPICIAYATDRADRGQIVAVNGGMMLSWGAGASLGPFMATFVMQWLGVGGLFLHAGTCAALLALYCAWRMTRRPPPPRFGTETPT